MGTFLRRAVRPFVGRKRSLPHFWQRSGGLGLSLGLLLLFGGFADSKVQAQTYQVRFVATGLSQPTGLAVSGLGDSDFLYFTELPEAAQGLGTNGNNTVSRLNINTGEINVLSRGDPQPTNVVQDAQGNLYWTSRAPGVIMMQAPSGACAILVWGLQQPVGLALDAAGENLYFTEEPTPGVFGINGGENKISLVNLTTHTRTILNTLEPAPTDIVVAKNGDFYFTCKSAGVIVHQDGVTQKHSILLAGLQQPTGIALDPTEENLVYTEVPTPGVSGDCGGHNAISMLNLKSGSTSIIHFGDPLPNSLAVTPNGNIYWTCTTAGVIREAKLSN